MQIDYTALRSLKSGHVVDTGYTINIALSTLDRSFKNEGSQVMSLSGNTVTTVHRREESFNVNTIIVEDVGTPDNDDMIEFLDSVVSGEVFQTDLGGSLVASILIGDYRRSRRGTLELFNYQFKVRTL